VLVLKSTNETSGQIIEYPIKYGRKNGRSIWLEKEMIDMLLMWGFLQKKGSWINVDKDLLEFCDKNKIDMPEKFQGTHKLSEILEENKTVRDLLKKFVEVNIINQ